MSYNDNVKIRAYSLFIQGTSYEEAARLLSKDFAISITPNTIKNWAEKKDKRGFSWADYRSDIRDVARQTVESVEKNRLVEIRDKTRTLVDSFYDQIVDDAALKVSSKDGALYAFKTLADFELKLEEKTKENMSVLVIIQMVLEIFSEVPDVKRVIQKYWKQIEKEIRIRVLHENPDNPDAQKMIEG
ncbi:MAG: hypothetical protein FWH53_00770 [Leptospirales bacterium]|nr:hypothetical protein [Leptospirales bacterium]